MNVFNYDDSHDHDIYQQGQEYCANGMDRPNCIPEKSSEAKMIMTLYLMRLTGTPNDHLAALNDFDTYM